MKRCAIYARYSSDLQSPSSIDDQIRLCRSYAERQEWLVVATFEDAALSGFGIEHRPGYRQLLAASLATPSSFEVILVEDLSRLTRDMSDGATDGKRTPPVCFAIDEHEADVVRRIFRDYARGKSMKMIAHTLNTDALPFPAKDTNRGPERRGWAVSAIAPRYRFDGSASRGAPHRRGRKRTTAGEIIGGFEGGHRPRCLFREAWASCTDAGIGATFVVGCISRQIWSKCPLTLCLAVGQLEPPELPLPAPR